LKKLALLTILCFTLAMTAARASGTVVVRQTDGHVDTYSNVSVKIAGNALFLRTADKLGTLVIPRAACSYRSNAYACYPTTATLVQGGEAGDLTIKSGTVYVNLSGASVVPSGATAAVAAHGISLSLQTRNGTHISANGRIDEVEK
jgi:hypothetical protein